MAIRLAELSLCNDALADQMCIQFDFIRVGGRDQASEGLSDTTTPLWTPIIGRRDTVSQYVRVHYKRYSRHYTLTMRVESRFQPRPAPPALVHVSIRPFAVRTASAAGSFKQRASTLRTSNFSFTGRGTAPASAVVNQRSTGDTTQLDSVPERHDSNSGCCCVIC